MARRPAGGPLDARTPATDALRAHAPLYFGQGALTRAYPDLEARTGGRAAVASAVLPMVLDQRPLGVLALDFSAPQRFPPAERRFLGALAAQCALALRRARLSGDLERRVRERTAALDAFVAYTEHIDGETDVLDLVRRAGGVLRAHLGQLSVAYYELDGDRWRARVWSEDLAPDLAEQRPAGLPAATPSFVRAVEAGVPLFLDAWDAAGEGLTPARRCGAVSLSPYVVAGQPRGLFATGTPERRAWTERDQAVVRAVGRGFGVALERAEQARQLQAQRDLLERQTRALKVANEELEAVAYSVSHDLRTPVRHIVGFHDLLRKSLGPGLTGPAARHLDVADQAARRMDGLIDAMLALSRTSRQPLRLEPVDLGALVSALRAEFAGLDQPVDWRVGPLPTVRGDRVLLRQVLANLLGNALKYARARDPARVEVWAEARPDTWAVFVRDNGVGFDPRYAHKLFGVFQRLHRPEDFEGTGVGLANVRRIVDKHGGQVFADGAPAQGATFGFCLPK